MCDSNELDILYFRFFKAYFLLLRYLVYCISEVYSTLLLYFDSVSKSYYLGHDDWSNWENKCLFTGISELQVAFL